MATVLDSQEARTYRETAAAFCALMEHRHAYPTPEWLKAVHLLLPSLYGAALALPLVEPDTEDPGEREVTHAEWQTLYTSLTELLGRWNYYFDVYDPYDEANREPVCGSLADDLADIYRDVKHGLLMARSVAASRPRDVLWTWRFEFQSHWAAHAAGALRALQTAFLTHYADHLPETFRAAPAGNEPETG